MSYAATDRGDDRQGQTHASPSGDGLGPGGDVPERRRPALGRRSFLAGLGAVGLAGLAGCTGGGGDFPAVGSAVASVDDARASVVRIVAQGSFVDPQVGYQANSAGSGTGFIIDPSGIAVTNNHVVTGAATLEVFANGRSYNATVLGVSECSDLAVIQIAGEGFQALQWHDGPIETNLEVWALGFPLGDPNYTVTRGIVSKRASTVHTVWASVDGVVEHDARIRPGNSGGPLVDERGRVVGVNYAGDNRFDINLAITAPLARGIVEDLRNGSDVNSIGINGRAVRSEDGSISGVWVSSVESGSPASGAGIQPADIIVRMEGLTLGRDGTMKDYCDILRSRNANDVLAVQVLRFTTGEVLAGEVNGTPLQSVLPPNSGGGGGGGSSNDDSGPSSAGYTNYRRVTDNSGAIVVDVPSEWSDVDGRAFEIGPGLVAAPDVDAYNNGYSTPGVSILASRDLSRNPNAVLDEFAFPACTASGRSNYDDGKFTGRLATFESCDGRDTSIVVIAATPPDDSYTILVVVQLVEPRDSEALDAVITTFDVTGSI
jgi:serine protease Do